MRIWCVWGGRHSIAMFSIGAWPLDGVISSTTKPKLILEPIHSQPGLETQLPWWVSGPHTRAQPRLRPLLWHVCSRYWFSLAHLFFLVSSFASDANSLVVFDGASSYGILLKVGGSRESQAQILAVQQPVNHLAGTIMEGFATSSLSLRTDPSLNPNSAALIGITQLHLSLSATNAHSSSASTTLSQDSLPASTHCSSS